MVSTIWNWAIDVSFCHRLFNVVHSHVSCHFCAACSTWLLICCVICILQHIHLFPTNHSLPPLSPALPSALCCDPGRYSVSTVNRYSRVLSFSLPTNTLPTCPTPPGARHPSAPFALGFETTFTQIFDYYPPIYLDYESTTSLRLKFVLKHSAANGPFLLAEPFHVPATL